MLRPTLVTFAALLTVWLLLNNSMANDVVMAGVVVSAILTLSFYRQTSLLSDFRATPAAFVAAFGYLFYFLKELIKSNLKLAAIVLAPTLPLRPGIVKVRTRLKSPMGRLMLANSITLTPGTLSVDLRGEWLYVHWVDMSSTDSDAATAAIVSGFEGYLGTMYG